MGKPNTDEPVPFVPQGFIDFKSALDLYCNIWFESNIKPIIDNILSSNIERPATEKYHNFACSLNRCLRKGYFHVSPDCDYPSDYKMWAYDYPEYETWYYFRQLLYDGVFMAWSFNNTRKPISIPHYFWGTNGAHEALDGSISGIENSDIAGCVLFREQELEVALADPLTVALRKKSSSQGFMRLAPSDPEPPSTDPLTDPPFWGIRLCDVVRTVFNHNKAKSSEATAHTITWKTAWEEVRVMLASGQLPSLLVADGDSIYSIACHKWAPGAAAFKSADPRPPPSRPWWIYMDTDDGPQNGNVIVLIEKPLCPLKTSTVVHPPSIAASAEPASSDEPCTRGRPSDYDLAAFYMEAAIILGRDGKPATQEELCRKAVDAYVEAGHMGNRPSMPWARDKVRRFWSRLNGQADSNCREE